MEVYKYYLLTPIHTSTAENPSTNPPYHHSLYPLPTVPTRNLHYPPHSLPTLIPFLASSLLLGWGNFAGFSSLFYFFLCLRNNLLNLSQSSAVLGIFRMGRRWELLEFVGRRLGGVMHIVWSSSANCVKYWYWSLWGIFGCYFIIWKRSPIKFLTRM